MNAAQTAFVEKHQRMIDKNIEEIHLEDFQKKVDGMSEEEKIVVLKSIKKTEVIIMEVLERVNRMEDVNEGVMKLFGINTN